LISANHATETVKVVRDSVGSDLSSTRNLALEALESMTSPRVAALIASLFEPSMTSAQRQQLGENSLNVHPPDQLEVFRKLLSPSQERILVLLTLHALGDIAAIQPQVAKPAKRKAFQLLEALTAPSEAPTEPPPPVFNLSPEIRALLEQMADSPDVVIQEAARTALQKIAVSQTEVLAEVAPVAQEEREIISLTERVIILKETAFFRNIPIAQLESLAQVSAQKKYEKDARIFKKGDPGGALYILVDGQVGIEQEKRAGSALLASIENNSYFGEMSLFDNSPRSASATALKASMVLELSRAPIITLTMQNPDLALELIKVLSQRIRETSDKMAEAARSRPRELHKLFDQFD